jgi:hypothetical protein
VLILQFTWQETFKNESKEISQNNLLAAVLHLVHSKDHAKKNSVASCSFKRPRKKNKLKMTTTNTNMTERDVSFIFSIF